MDIIVEKIASEFIGQYAFISFFVVLLFILKTAVITIRDFPHIYEEVFFNRQIKRQKALIELTKSDSQMNGFIKDMNKEEVFKLVTGIKTSINCVDSLMIIYATGMISKKDLKSIARYIKPIFPNGKIAFRVNILDKTIFAYSLVAGMFFVSLLIYIGFTTLRLAGLGFIYFITGLLLITLISIVIRIVSKDFITYLILVRLKEKLKSTDMLFESEQLIGFKIFHIFVKKLGFF